jgi:uncharacterized protein
MFRATMANPEQNPFRFGDLALDQFFTDREAELAELTADIRNGQNVVIFAPRRFGKSSLMWRAAQQLVSEGSVLIAQVDLMKAPTKERLAEKLAAAIYEDIASPLFKLREQAVAVFRGLRILPSMNVGLDGSMSFSFAAGHASADIDATLEHLLELPAQLAADRGRRAALVLDEFQEIMRIDPGLLALMRAVFQEQPEVAHVYLGSRQHMIEQVFNDENEPFWRSAKQLELGPIPAEPFAEYIADGFNRSGRRVRAETVTRLLEISNLHPYGTQELAYALWEATAPRRTAGDDELGVALSQVLRSENAHFSRIWERAARAQRLVLEALARSPGGQLQSSAYRRDHGLPAASTVQKALTTLADDELVSSGADGYRIAEPFLAEWILARGM